MMANTQFTMAIWLYICKCAGQLIFCVYFRKRLGGTVVVLHGLTTDLTWFLFYSIYKFFWLRDLINTLEILLEKLQYHMTITSVVNKFLTNWRLNSKAVRHFQNVVNRLYSGQRDNYTAIVITTPTSLYSILICVVKSS